VALRLRIRHKLFFGLLWVGMPMLILLGATLQALVAHRTTVKMIESRQQEQKAAGQLADLVAGLQSKNNQPPNAGDVKELVEQISAAVSHYEQHLNNTLRAGRDRDNGYEERGYLTQIRAQVRDLPNSVQPHRLRQGMPTASAWQQDIDQLAKLTAELCGVIDTDVQQLVAAADASYRQTRLTVLAISAAGFVLLMILARLTYTWIATPIRDLHEKVTQLTQGNFTGHVQIQSGDEMQELAVAFNAMADQLRETYHDLERQVQERSKQLVRSERLAGVGFLAAGVAHEINNPLASISFCGEALERRLKDWFVRQPDHPDVPLIQRYVAMIQQEAFRCKEITQKLLEFSRMGDRPKQMSDLAGLVQGVLEMVQHLPNHKEKRIVFEVQQRPHLLLSAPEIKSVVLNLVVNALESMDEGGLLTIRLNVVHDQAVLTFSDNGCGMSQEVLENLFEPFFTRSRTGKGTGLGLSISHRIVSQHGGEIEAASAGQGNGSSFTVRIPLRQAEPAPQQDPVAAVLKKAA
jgi:two-component system NtrC family sensor kinase